MMPIFSRPWTIGVAVAYLLVMIAIGVWAARRTRSARDFFIAGQRLGAWVIAFATMSAAFSGFVFLGGPGLTYKIGLSSLLINASIGYTAALLCWTVGKKLRLLAGAREIYTLPDAVAVRFESRWATSLSATAVAVGTVGYLGAQLLALGILLEAIFGTPALLGAWSLPAAIAVGLLVLLFYSVAGGMIAGVYTDVVQGILMLIAAIGVFYWALHVGGGWSRTLTSIASAKQFGAPFLSPFGRVSALTGLGFLFVFGIGVLGQPHMLHKFFMLEDAKALRWLPLLLGGSQALCLLIWFGIGVAVPALVAQGRLVPLGNPDRAAPLFLLRFTPDLLAGVALAGVLAAIMSTADSLLNIGAAAVVRDLPGAWGKKLKDELTWGRWATVLLALGAAVLGYFYGDLIALLGTFAFGTFAAALAPTLAVGLNWTAVDGTAAAWSIGSGLAGNLIFEWLARQQSFPALPRFPAGALPSAVALALSFAVLFLVTGLRSAAKRVAIPGDIAAIVEGGG